MTTLKHGILFGVGFALGSSAVAVAVQVMMMFAGIAVR